MSVTQQTMADSRREKNNWLEINNPSALNVDKSLFVQITQSHYKHGSGRTHVKLNPLSSAIHSEYCHIIFRRSYSFVSSDSDANRSMIQ